MVVAGLLRFFWENKVKKSDTRINYHRAKSN